MVQSGDGASFVLEALGELVLGNLEGNVAVRWANLFRRKDPPGGVPWPSSLRGHYGLRDVSGPRLWNRQLLNPVPAAGTGRFASYSSMARFIAWAVGLSAMQLSATFEPLKSLYWLPPERRSSS